MRLFLVPSEHNGHLLESFGVPRFPLFSLIGFKGNISGPADRAKKDKFEQAGEEASTLFLFGCRRVNWRRRIGTRQFDGVTRNRNHTGNSMK